MINVYDNIYLFIFKILDLNTKINLTLIKNKIGKKLYYSYHKI